MVNKVVLATLRNIVCGGGLHSPRVSVTRRPLRTLPSGRAPGLASTSSCSFRSFQAPPALKLKPKMLGLDRKQMEEERLARNAKKRPADAAEDEAAPKKASKLETTDNLQTIPVSSEATPKVDPNQSRPDTVEVQAGNHLQFPQGAMRKTWAFGHERLGDIKIEEVLQKKDLKTAVISSFNWDFDWLVTKFDPSTKFILVMQARNYDEKKRIQGDFESLSKKVRLCFPPMSGYAYACMHSKLMLLFYSTHLRVVVPSANCVPYDWGETGIMENSVFLIDLPRLPEDKQGHANDTLTGFSKELSRFLHAMEIHEDVRIGMLNFDFSNTKDIQFVHTIGGTHVGGASKHTGLPGLSRAVRGLNLETPTKIPLQADMAASSVGAIDKEFIETLYSALRGSEPKASASSKSKASAISISSPSVAQDNFRLIFPSRETVQQSTGGPQNGGTIYLKPEYYKRANFPSKVIRDYKSRRPGLLSHNKLIFARTPTTAFFYHGSANISQAAWGRLSYDKSSKDQKLTATNWECGVLMPVRRKEADEAGEAKVVLPMDVFDEVFGVPFEYPAKPYEEGQLPWCAGT